MCITNFFPFFHTPNHDILFTQQQQFELWYFRAIFRIFTNFSLLVFHMCIFLWHSKYFSLSTNKSNLTNFNISLVSYVYFNYDISLFRVSMANFSRFYLSHNFHFTFHRIEIHFVNDPRILDFDSKFPFDEEQNGVFRTTSNTQIVKSRLVKLNIKSRSFHSNFPRSSYRVIFSLNRLINTREDESVFELDEIFLKRERLTIWIEIRSV